jgi:spore germination protein GerM
MKRTYAAVVVAGAVAVACSNGGATPLGTASVAPSTSSSSGSPTPTPTESPSSSATPTSTPVQTATVEVWFYDPNGALFQSSRSVVLPAVAGGAIRELLAGPGPVESAAGLTTGVPDETSLLGITIHDGVATVDLSDAFTDQDTPAQASERLSQVVYTMTQFASIESVRFRVDGAPLTNLGGFELDRPQTRADFAYALPAILVQSPGITDRVSSPAAISGTADVFEAVVSIEIRDANGTVLSSAFTMATCGTGCRGTYSTTVRYDVDSTQPGMIVVFEVSAMDGSPQHVVRIPVTLTA